MRLEPISFFRLGFSYGLLGLNFFIQENIYTKIM